MALPINKPQLGGNEPEKDQPLEAPKRPAGLNLPAEIAGTSDVQVKPLSFKGASLDADIEDREDAILAQKDKIGTTRARLNNGLEANTFQMSTALTSDDLLYTPWERYAALMPKVVEVKAWLQSILSEQGRTADVAEARFKRGLKYDEMRVLIDTLLVKYFTQENIIQGRDASVLMTLITNEILGLGPIEPLWLDPRISEIMVNGPHSIVIEIQGKLMEVPGARFRDTEHLLDVCQQILAPINKVIDTSHTYEDGRLSDGSRVNITHPEIGPAGPFLTIRRFPETAFTLRTLVEFGAMDEATAEEVANLIYAGCSTVVSGGTGSGKTSTLNALSGCIPMGVRIITVEDNLELRLHPNRHVVALEARKGQHDGAGAVTIRNLVTNTLRMRPDRIIVGEVRDGSAYDMLQAMNTGHDGSMTTVHANDAPGAIERLINLISEVGEIDSNRAMSLIAGGVDVIVTIERYEDGSRRCSGVYEIPNRVTAENGIVSLDPIPLYEFVQDGLDEDDKIYGHYEKRNDVSASMIRKHRLNNRPRLTLEEFYAISDF